MLILLILTINSNVAFSVILKLIYVYGLNYVDERGERSNKKEKKSYYNEETEPPCHLSSSIYYGGQEKYSSTTTTTHDTTVSHIVASIIYITPTWQNLYSLLSRFCFSSLFLTYAVQKRWRGRRFQKRIKRKLVGR